MSFGTSSRRSSMLPRPYNNKRTNHTCNQEMRVCRIFRSGGCSYSTLARQRKLTSRAVTRGRVSVSAWQLPTLLGTRYTSPPAVLIKLLVYTNPSGNAR